MKQINLPYGKGFKEIQINENRLTGILLSEAHHFKAVQSEEEIVKAAIENPIDSPRLCELAKGKNNIVIIASDHTRPVPSKIIMPQLLNEIRSTNPDANIKILIATGCHRETTVEELVSKFGEDIVKNEEIIVHDCADDDNMVKLGILPSGGELIINKLAVEADLLISEGFIEPHFFAGFSGGRKSVLPGIASTTTVLANHCSEFIVHDKARTGILEGNPIHEDMIFAAEKANLAFILNVVIDSDKKVINAFAGHYNNAHVKGTEFVASLAGVKSIPSNIVITTNGGYPLDQNIYQAVKGMTAAEATCNNGGVIIMVAECNDGHGGEAFFDTFAKEKNVQKIMDTFLATGRNETIPDQWQSQIFARVLLKHTIIMVTDAPKEMVEGLHMKWASSVEEAIKMADEIIGKDDSKITVIPDGVSVTVL
jgi:lactate racemase